MSFNFNGNIPKEIFFNNQEVKKLIYNGNVVWKKIRLPRLYTEVEYIESSGTQYIDTGVTGTQNTKVDIEFQATGTNFLPFGARSTASSNCFAIWAASSSVGSNLRIGFANSSGYTGKATTKDKYHIIHSKDGTYVNNELVWSIGSFSTFTTPQNLLVFGYYSNATTRSLSAIRLYHLKLWENNIMVRDFIPCYRNSDGEIGLYDSINDIFYTNQGTGVFIKGKDVYTLPNEYQEVEYIESTGTQWIDTGVIPDNRTGISMKLSINDINSDKIRIGCRQTSGDTRFWIGTTRGVAYFGFGKNYGTANNDFKIQSNIPFIAYLNYKNNRTCYVDDYTPLSLGSVSWITFTFSIVMFGRNTYSGITGSAQKVYSCQISQDNELIRYFIPCYRKSDNKPGMYDLVNDVFYTNAGTGEFIIGDNI